MYEDSCSSCQPINEQYSLEHVDNVLLLFNWLKSHLRCSIIYLLNFGYILVTFWLHFGYDQNVTNLCQTFWLHFGYILVTLWLRFGAFWLHFGYVLVAFWLRFGYILVTFWLYFGNNQNVTNLCRASPTVP